MNDADNENDAANNKINNKTATSKSFEYKTNYNNNSRLNEVVVPWKYFSNFWRSHYLPLFNCEVELYLTWPKNCVISEISRTPEVGRDKPVDAILATGATFQINNTKLHVPMVTLSTNANISK